MLAVLQCRFLLFQQLHKVDGGLERVAGITTINTLPPTLVSLNCVCFVPIFHFRLFCSLMHCKRCVPSVERGLHESCPVGKTGPRPCAFFCSVVCVVSIHTFFFAAVRCRASPDGGAQCRCGDQRLLGCRLQPHVLLGCLLGHEGAFAVILLALWCFCFGTAQHTSI